MKEFKGKTTGELKKLIAEKREALRGFRFGSAGARTKNVKFGRTVKKDIARIMTEMSLQAKAK